MFSRTACTVKIFFVVPSFRPYGIINISSFFLNSFTIILKSLVERYCLVSAGNVRHNRLISSKSLVSPEINLFGKSVMKNKQ